MHCMSILKAAYNRAAVYSRLMLVEKREQRQALHVLFAGVSTLHGECREMR